MVAPLTVRISLHLCAAVLCATLLASCSGLPRSLTISPGETSVFALISRQGPKLTLRNDSGGKPNDIYSEAADQLSKVVPDAELQALLDVFTADKLFELSIPSVPGNARDVLRLEQGGRTWFWVRRGSFTDPREQAFNKGRSYFLSLYNGSTAYHSGPSSDDGRYPTFLDEKQQQIRRKELQKLDQDLRKSGGQEKRR
ncbi:MAG: hypothetical protein ACI85K_001576 [Hyphomicrobiaceae bacterium]|jgi:hypothetical protein